jgi:hypothetical protein
MLGWQELYLDNSDHLSARCVPGDIPHLPLTAPSPMSASDLTMAPLSSPWSVAAPWETLALEELSPEAREAPVL